MQEKQGAQFSDHDERNQQITHDDDSEYKE
jgi:hypothetical protein